MDTDYKHIPKTDKQLSNWFGEKVRQDKSNFLNFEEFKVWYENSKKACHYCGLTEEESQKIVRTNKLHTTLGLLQFGLDGISINILLAIVLQFQLDVINLAYE